MIIVIIFKCFICNFIHSISRTQRATSINKIYVAMHEAGEEIVMFFMLQAR